MKNKKDAAAYDYRGVRWKTVEEQLAIILDGAVLIREDAFGECPRALVALPRKHPTEAAIQRSVARIIAAAPELLTVLEDIVALYDPQLQPVELRMLLKRAGELIDRATKNE